MRKVILVLLVSLLGSNLAYADGMILPEALSPDYLAVRYHHVTVSIEDGHAVTRVEQEFYNPHPVSVSGRYLFPVPPDAILSRFQATVDGEQQTIARQDAATTNAVLYDIVAQRHDPSLLQYADWESLALDLSLPAGGSRRMSLEYEEVLVPAGGLYRYRYILSTERYSLQPLESASLTLDVRSSSGLSTLYSSTHAVSTERLGPGHARVSWEAQNVHPTEDFELFFAPSEGGFGSGLLTGRRDDQDHFMFLFAPEAEPVEGDAIPKDIVFVIDRSGSMSGEKIEQAHNALRFVLGQLDEDDRFSIVGFDHRLAVLDYELQKVNAETLSNARQFVSRLTAEGDTNLEAALQAGLDILAHSEPREASNMVLFLTDGLPTAGVTDEGLIARLVTQANARQEARLHVFGVGYDVNTHLLDRLAADNGGVVTYVQPGESLEMALTGFYARIAQPVLTDVEVEIEGLEIGDLYPGELPDMFEGSSLLLTGRYQATAEDVTVRVRGWAGEEAREFVYHFDLAGAGEHDFVPRLWATRRVGELLDRVRVEGESAALVSEIREIGLGYGLVTPYTTVVIQAQADGAASADNMALYGNQAELNQAWGQVTVQARVQNQLYQQADQANLANGANVLNNAQHSLAQVANQNVDLSLLQGQENLDEPLTLEWIERNVGVDRNVVFGSDEYFVLAGDPAARPFLQSGTNVVFGYQGQVIAVQDPNAPEYVEPAPQPVAANQAGETSNQATINTAQGPNALQGNAAPAPGPATVNQTGASLEWWDVLYQWLSQLLAELMEL
jgi:Ca-activated chloride channel family protein